VAGVAQRDFDARHDLVRHVVLEADELREHGPRFIASIERLDSG
jgi:hypothetical protein